MSQQAGDGSEPLPLSQTMAPFTDIAVTYMSAPPHGDDKFARVGKTATPAYIWAKRGDGQPITEIKVTHANVDLAGEGLTKVPEDLNNGSHPDKPCFLWVRKGGDQSPIIDIKVVHSDDQVGPGFAKLSDVLNPNADKAVPKDFLCVKTKASQQKAESLDLKKGDELDCKDTSSNWCMSKIMDERMNNGVKEFFIHYTGWSEKWDEWLAADNSHKRFAPFRSKTLGKSTGWEGDKDAFQLKDKKEEFLAHVKKFTELAAIVESKETKELSKEDLAWLTTKENFVWTSNVLNSIVDDEVLLPEAQKFLQANLKLIARVLATETEVAPGYLDMLFNIMKGNDKLSRFYSKYGVKGTEEAVGKYAARPTVTQPVNADKNNIQSSYFIENVNFFGECGGFDAIRARITDPKFARDSFITANALLRSLATMRSVLVKSWAIPYLRELKLPDYLRATLKKITEFELKNVGKDHLSDLVKDVESLLKLANQSLDEKKEAPQVNIPEWQEHINLDIALRLLHSVILEKELQGCNELDEAIKRVQRKERDVKTKAGDVAVAPGPEGPPSKFLTAEYMIKWIEENKVVQLFLSSGKHEQILKKSPTVLKFLASNNALSVDHVEQLWNSANGKHENLVRIVYDTIANLSEELSPDQLEQLYKRMTAKPATDFSDFYLNFIKNFTVSAVKASQAQNKDSKSWFGLDLFWQMIQDESKVSNAIAQQALTTLKELLEQPLFDSQRPVYLEKCIAGLRDGNSVVSCLRLAKLILASYPAAPKDSTTISSSDAIAQCEEKAKIISLLLLDLERYAGQVRKQVGDNASAEPPATGRYAHNVQMSARLDFLDFVVSHSTVLLSPPGVDVLWRVFVTNAVTPDDKNMLLEWLTQALDEPARHPQPCFNPDVAQYIFTEYLGKKDKLDYVHITKKGYDAFETFFVHINHANASLSTTSRRFVAVQDFKLIGLPSLWEIATLASDQSVGETARHFLNTCHIRLDFKFTATEKKAIFKSFVDKCMDGLRDASKALVAKQDVEANKHHVNALLDVLENFLSRCEAGEVVQKPKFNLGDQCRATWKGGQKLYDCVVREVNKDGTYWLSYSDGDNDRACPEHLIMPITDKPAEEKRPADDSTQYPLLILSNERSYFDLLFELLEVGGDVAPKVWKLLCRLPTNIDLSGKLMGLANHPETKVNWEEVLPTKSAIKLLYSLQLIDRDILAPAASEADDKKDARAVAALWCQNFLSQGGFAHLYTILTTMDEQSMLADALPQQCLGLVLKLVNHFLTTGATESIFKQVDLPAFINKLLATLRAVCEVKLPEDPKPKGKSKSQETTTTSSSSSRVYGPLLPGQIDIDMTTMTSSSSSSSAAPEDPLASLLAPVPEDVFGNLVVNLFNILIAAVQQNTANLTLVTQFSGWKDIVTKGLIGSRSDYLRKWLGKEIFTFCNAFNKTAGVQPPRVVFLPMLLDSLENVEGKLAARSRDYFNLTRSLLSGWSTEDSTLDSEKLGNQLAQKIKVHEPVEKRPQDVDYVLCGYVNLLSVLVQRFPALKEPLGSKGGLVEELYHCLFDLPAMTSDNKKGKDSLKPPKCKSTQSRSMAYKLLAEFAKDCMPNAKALVSLLNKNHLQTHSAGGRPDDWSFEAKGEEKSETGYCGLKNLGCICYMNATLQQFFMIPKLRQNILSIETPADLDHKESVLYQLQLLLAHLQESEKQYGNPADFCWALRDLEGKRTNVSVQEDSQEFFNRLLDQIDEAVKNTPHKDAVKDALGGVLTHEFISKTANCPHYREREEQFYAIPVEVQHKKTLGSALEAFIQNEVMEGSNAYKCTHCNAKVDTIKRQSIKKLPSTIVFCLKRFAMNYETMQPVKLNDRLEFPMKVNLKNLCREAQPSPQQIRAGVAAAGGAVPEPEIKEVEGKSIDELRKEKGLPPLEPPPVLEDEFYDYMLRGVVVHTGSVTHGHYYSFIKERLEGDDPEAGRWFEFNDHRVTPFDPKDIANECFGGVEAPRSASTSRWQGMGSSSNTVQGGGYEKMKSAYVLFYDRVKKPDTEAKTSENTEVAVQRPASASLSKAAAAEKAKVPSNIFQKLWDENLSYYRDRNVFDPAYFDFVWELVHNQQETKEVKEGKEVKAAPPSLPIKPEASEMLQFVTYYVFNIYARAAQKDKLGDWIGLLKEMYKNNVAACAWLLETMASTKWNAELLLHCHESEMRAGITSLISLAFSLLLPLESQSLTLPLPAKVEAKDGDKKEEVKDERGVVVRYIDSVVTMLPLVPKRWKTFDPFFKVLAQFASMGLAEAQYLEKHNLTARLIDLYLGDESPNKEISNLPVDSQGRRQVMGDQYGSPDVTHFLVLLRHLVCSTIATEGTESTPPTLTLSSGVKAQPINKVALDMLLHKSFMPRFLLEATTRRKGKAVSDVVVHIAWENEKLSQNVIAGLFAGMEQNNLEATRAYFRVLMPLVLTKDSLQTKRVEWILNSLLNVMKVQQKYWRVTDMCSEHLIRMAKRSPECYAWLNARPQSFEWLIKWLQTNKTPPRGYGGQEQTVLDKPGGKKDRASRYRESYDDMSMSGPWAPLTASTPVHAGLTTLRKAQALQAIQEGTELDTEGASDSDVDLAEREFVVGQWVDIQDNKNWLCGQVYAVSGVKVYVHYDGWEDRYNVWLDKSSPRLQPLGRHTTRSQIKHRGEIFRKRA